MDCKHFINHNDMVLHNINSLTPTVFLVCGVRKTEVDGKKSLKIVLE